MTRCTVDGCARPTAGAFVCDPCQQKLRDALESVHEQIHPNTGRPMPGLAAELDLAVTRQTRIGSAAGGRSTGERPLLFSQDASRVRSTAENTFRAWLLHAVAHGRRRIAPLGPTCRECTHPSCEMTRGSFPGLALCLVFHLPRILGRVDAGQAVDELSYAVAIMRNVIDRPADRVYVGPCLSPLPDRSRCTTDLYAHHGADTIACPVCSVEYDVTKRRTWLLAQAEDQLARPAEIARAVSALGQPVKVERIRQWVHRGRLIPHTFEELGRNVDGQPVRIRPLYRVGDVLALIAEQESKTV